MWGSHYRLGRKMRRLKMFILLIHTDRFIHVWGQRSSVEPLKLKTAGVKCTDSSCGYRWLIETSGIMESVKTIPQRQSEGRNLTEPGTYHFDELWHGHLKLNYDRVGHILHWSDVLVIAGEDDGEQPVLCLGAGNPWTKDTLHYSAWTHHDLIHRRIHEPIIHQDI